MPEAVETGKMRAIDPHPETIEVLRPLSMSHKYVGVRGRAPVRSSPSAPPGHRVTAVYSHPARISAAASGAK